MPQLSSDGAGTAPTTPFTSSLAADAERAARGAIDAHDLRGALQSERAAVMAAPVYERLTDAASLRRFMASHVFAVWDFQSLLTAVQRHVTCVDVPWTPGPDREAVRLVNEIVLDEESDEALGGGHASHFELYVEAMEAAGADTGPVLDLITRLRRFEPFDLAIGACGAPDEAVAFTRTTLRVARSGAPHEVAAAFAYGREEVIPDMFRQVVAQLAERDPAAWGPFRHYLELHIETDEDRHGPGARRLVGVLCDGDEQRAAEALAAAQRSLTARAELWRGIAASLDG